MSALVQCMNLTKCYVKGKAPAVSDLNLTIYRRYIHTLRLIFALPISLFFRYFSAISCFFVPSGMPPAAAGSDALQSSFPSRSCHTNG